jgi:hypothetical protein
LPKVKKTAWVANPVDAFILSRLEENGLSPSPPASRLTLLRRVSFDLTGLPPTAEAIDRYLNDPKPGAYERMVDRTVASLAFGERWARHWLDLARYADSNGYEFDELRPNTWRYRDYVIRSFNADKPYDRFVKEQLSGDELYPNDPDALIATGFNLLGPDMTDSADQVARRHNTLNDMTDTTGLVFLGLTVGCARCHDHKYEPLTQRDYYALQSHFVGARFRTDLPAYTPAQAAEHGEAQRRYSEIKLLALGDARDFIEAWVAENLAEFDKAAGPALKEAQDTPPVKRTPAQRDLLARRQSLLNPSPESIRAQLKAADYPDPETIYRQLVGAENFKPESLPITTGLWEDAPPPPTYLLERGEISNQREEIQPGFPAIFPPIAAPTATLRAGSPGRRAALAGWIADGRNPLTARVWVNRIWQHLFGRGLVPTTSDLGVRGESVTHLELLDYLSLRLTGSKFQVPGSKGGVSGDRRSVSTGEKASPTRNTQHPTPGLAWSTKSLLRLLLTSNAYRQSSLVSPAVLAKDPENTWFSRQNRRRLEAEAIRDASLLVGERLSWERYGPPVMAPPDDAEPAAKAKEPPAPLEPPAGDDERRSIYLLVRRNRLSPQLEALDPADTNQSCPRRETSTTAPQALLLLNSDEMQKSARSFAGRVIACAKTDERRLNLAYHLAFCRPPTASEAKLAAEFLARQTRLLRSNPDAENRAPTLYPKTMEPARAAAWTDLCLGLMNANEFLYVD